MFWVLGVCGEVYDRIGMKKEGTPKGQYLLLPSQNTRSSKHCHPPPRMWIKYVDDIFVIQKEDHKKNFLEQINSVDPAIRFTVEDNKEDGTLPSLDTSVKPEADARLSIIVYRKPTHTDQYLQRDSHH